MKYFILITNSNNNNVEKYVIIDDTIKKLHNYMIEKIKDYIKSDEFNVFKIPLLCGQLPSSGNEYDHTFIEISESDADFIINININNLTRSQLSKLILLYVSMRKVHILEEIFYKK